MDCPIDRTNFLIYLKKNYPYLYDFEMEVRKVAEATGFGDVSVSCIIRNRKVFSIDLIGVKKSLYGRS